MTRARPKHGKGSYEERALKVALLLSLALMCATGLLIWRYSR